MSDNNNSSVDAQLQPYIDCIAKQLEELELLTSIYCTPGEFHIHDASVISDLNDFLAAPVDNTIDILKAHLEYTIKLNVLDDGNKLAKLDVRIELPHLYPLIEHAIIIVHTPLLTKAKEQHFKAEIERYIASMDKQETYVFQVLSWLQEQIELLIKRDASEFELEKSLAAVVDDPKIECERLWIYSHHIKSKRKRQEIVKQARNLDLSGFSRPGKPGIICVEGETAQVQEFWRIVRAMRWQKIGICLSEPARKPREKLNDWRRFQGFEEQLYGIDENNEDCVVDMAQFINYLETHKSGYMKKELFGLA